MKYKYLILILFILCYGCAPLVSKDSPSKPFPVEGQDGQIKTEPSQPPTDRDPTAQKDPIVPPPDIPDTTDAGQGEEPEAVVIKKGLFFAKTEFYGVLQTNYVQLFIDDLNNPKKRFYLHIGEPVASPKLPWELTIVEPGYFYIDLDPGHYKIVSLSIPVGTTMATEEMNVYFNVEPDTVTYGGTLIVEGTKERIKLGGVPVIKPGFEYVVKVLDQSQEGMSAFKEKFPEDTEREIKIDLMKIDPIQ